jgi:hypothetical protein
MEAAYNGDISENVKRPLPEGTIVCFKDLYNKACIGRVKASGMYILWVELIPKCGGLEEQKDLFSQLVRDVINIFSGPTSFAGVS